LQKSHSRNVPPTLNPARLIGKNFDRTDPSGAVLAIWCNGRRTLDAGGQDLFSRHDAVSATANATVRSSSGVATHHHVERRDPEIERAFWKGHAQRAQRFGA
jgi:hypothetical protein